MNKQQSPQHSQNLNISDSVLETVQIGGIAGRDLKLTQIQGKVESMTVLGSVQVNQAPVSAAKPLSQPEYRSRQVLVSKVKSFWIEGVLAKSLHIQVLIELGLEERSEFIHNPLSEVEEFPSDSGQTFPAGTTATDIFEGIGTGRTLLILGEPGSGKTVTLLKLAESLIARTENDLSQPLPIVVNLSSWAKQRKSIADWLVQELYEIYGASKSLGKAWVEQEQLILLLDGLDEVNAQYRNDCVKALNQFIQGHGLTEIVICSRIRDYENLSERLKLRSAIYVKSLTSQQIDQFLDRVGESLSLLKTVFQHNTELRAFASSPLILSIMSLTYQNNSVETLTPIEVTQDLHKQLFDKYVSRMFIRRGTTRQYSRQQTRYWLIWLAQQMVYNSQAIFLIERLQPDWLLTQTQRISYRIVSGLIFSLIIALILSPLMGISMLSTHEIIFQLLSLEQISLEQIPDELLILNDRTILALFGSTGGLIYAAIGGLWVSILGKIKTVETLKWSWREAYSSFRPALIVALIISLFAGVVSGVFFGVVFGVVSGVVFGVFLGVVFGVVSGLIGGFRGPEIQHSNVPNQGIWKSAQNALLVGLSASLTLGISSGFLFVLIYGLTVGLLTGLFYMIVGMLVGVLTCGGLSCFRHLILRFSLYCLGYTPWNYAKFIDNAADHLFLQKVGGGYIFVHRMLLEHFAQMDFEQEQR